MAFAVIALGSNVGDSLAVLNEAVGRLHELLAVSAVSSWYRTNPLYIEDQAEFLNGVLIGETPLAPLALLQRLKEMEASLGRTPAARYGPRLVDLDLIAYGSLVLSSVTGSGRPLTLPHAHVGERRFVLEPLAEIAPRLVLPGMGTPVALLQARTWEGQECEKLV